MRDAVRSMSLIPVNSSSPGWRELTPEEVGDLTVLDDHGRSDRSARFYTDGATTHVVVARASASTMPDITLTWSEP